MANTFISSVVIIGLTVLVIALVVRTISFSHAPHPVHECKPTDADFIPLSDARLNHFQDALRFQTISWDKHKYNTEDLKKFGDFIINSFPFIHKKSPYIEWERVNKYSLLYHIKGTDPNLKPYLLLSHLDVVPATELDLWEAPPFSGDVIDGFIYGRGAIDVKQCVMGIMEATEFMLERNTRPVRSFYIAFGHDEEVTGLDGAGFISKRLLEKGVTEFEYIHDEGMTITQGIFKGVEKPVAAIGVTEKGLVFIKLSVTTASGHSSMPPKESSIGILSSAVSRLEASPHPSMLGSGIETTMLEHLAPEMNVPMRFLVSNIWFFKPIISWFMSKAQTTNSLIRTVTSPTMFNSGIKMNVMPATAEAIINHRVHPSQSVKEVIDYDRSVIADERVKIEIMHSMEPHPVSGYGETDFGFQVLKTSIRQVWSDAAVVPSMLMGNTDTIHYLNFTNNVYRFAPTFMKPGDPQRFHGNNERISKDNYEKVINFYYHLIRNSDQAAVSPVHKPHDDL